MKSFAIPVRFLFPKFFKKNTLQDLSLEDLTRQQVALEASARTLNRKIESTEKEKETEFKKAVAQGSDRQRLNAAKKIETLDRILKQCDAQISEIYSNQRVNAGIIRLKEDAEFRKKLHVNFDTTGVTSQAVREEIEKAMIDDEVRSKDRDRLISELENHEAGNSYSHEDSGVMAIYQQILQAAEDSIRVPEGLPSQNELSTYSNSEKS